MISTRNLVNVLLVLAIVGLGLVVVFEPGKAPPPAKEKLTALNPADIQRIEIQGTTGTPIILERHADKWRLHGLAAVEVSAGKIDTLLSLAHATSQAQYAAASMDLKQAGLAQPELQVVLGDTRLSFGGTEPINGHRYVLVGDKVHLINDRYSYLLHGEAATFVDSALLPADATLSEIHAPKFTLREENGHWLVEGGKSLLSADELQRFVDDWRYARALRVSAAPEKAVTGETVELWLKQTPEPLRFAVLKADDDMVFTRLDVGLQYHFTTTVADKLLQLPTPAATAKAK